MAIYTSLIISVAITFLGVAGLLRWWYPFFYLLKAVVPALLIFAGLIGIVAALSELKDKASANRQG